MPQFGLAVRVILEKDWGQLKAVSGVARKGTEGTSPSSNFTVIIDFEIFLNLK